jgi:hypothetical protein
MMAARFRRRAMNWAAHRILELVGIAGAIAALSACVSNPMEQITRRSSVGSGQAILVVGVAHEDGVPYRGFTIALKEYSFSTEKLFVNCFSYNRWHSFGLPESASAKYFVYRVPAGIYAVSFDVAPPPNAPTFLVPAGQAVYVGDLAHVGNGRRMALRNDLPAAENAVAALLPGDLPLVMADSAEKPFHWTTGRCGI